MESKKSGNYLVVRLEKDEEIITALRQVFVSEGIKGVFSIEYEHNWLNSLPEIAQCVKYFDKIAAELAANS